MNWKEGTDPGVPEAVAGFLYHYCRLQLPEIRIPFDAALAHLQRTFCLFHSKNAHGPTWSQYLENLYTLDWYTACACLEGDGEAWQHLFSARAHRADALLVDALRARAARLYPSDEERQEGAVTEFWSQLLVGDRPVSEGVLFRYDGQRPLVPWLIRVFQNWHVSQLRHRNDSLPLPDSDIAEPITLDSSLRWHEAFRQAAREWLAEATDQELLLLGLRLRYRLSQRQVAKILETHEGTISRHTTQLRDRCLNHITGVLLAQGWDGEGLEEYIRTEMAGLLLDDPRLSADSLAARLKTIGKGSVTMDDAHGSSKAGNK
jgi:RNA polymerase sigma factor (sigma-70 family)